MVKTDDVSGQDVILLIVAACGVYQICKWLGGCCCKGGCCCCRARAADNTEQTPPTEITLVRVPEMEDKRVRVEHLRCKKERVTAYALYFGAGIFGAHHFYLERYIHGVAAALSLNFFFVGFFFDLLFIPWYTSSHNKWTAAIAKQDRSCRRLCCYTPLVMIVAFCVLSLVAFRTPAFLNDVGIVDLDAKKAGTNDNPYVLLGISRNAFPVEVNKAFQDRSLDAERQCAQSTKKCKKLLHDLKKAHEYVHSGKSDAYQKFKKQKAEKATKSKRKRKDSDDIDWGELGFDWYLIGEEVKTSAKELGDWLDQKFSSRGGQGESESAPPHEDL